MARSMACELGPQRIRVNSLSPRHIYTRMTAALLDVQPELGTKWANSNPLGRLGKPEELRGVIGWLASDASTFCTGSELSLLRSSSPLNRTLLLMNPLSVSWSVVVTPYGEKHFKACNVYI